MKKVDIDDEKEVKKSKRNIKILVILAIIIIIIPIYIIVRVPFGIMYLSAFGNDIRNFITFSQNEKREEIDVSYNPLKIEVQKEINDNLANCQIMKKRAKNTEEIQRYEDKIKQIVELYKRLQQTEKEEEITKIKNELSIIISDINKEDIKYKVENENTRIENENNRVEFERKYNEAINNLDKSVFLVEVDNYNPESNDIKISEEKVKEIAQKGFEESARRIAGEGADNKESETIQIREESPNNYFTRYYYEGDKIYTNKKRNCYVITRENEMGNGISIFVDVTTGIIIGGEAFGD